MYIVTNVALQHYFKQNGINFKEMLTYLGIVKGLRASRLWHHAVDIEIGKSNYTDTHVNRLSMRHFPYFSMRMYVYNFKLVSAYFPLNCYNYFNYSVTKTRLSIFQSLQFYSQYM